MNDLFASGRVVDLVLAVMVVEALALALYRRSTGRGLALIDVVAMLVPGACLLLALRTALAGADGVAIALWLTVALAAHLVDLYRRAIARR